MKSVETMRTLKCIGDPIGTEQMSNAMWTGVPLRNILKKAGVKDEAKMVVFRCADGYHTAIPIADAMRKETLIAYKMNGEPLPPMHGYPLRLVVPGGRGFTVRRSGESRSEVLGGRSDVRGRRPRPRRSCGRPA